MKQKPSPRKALFSAAQFAVLLAAVTADATKNASLFRYYLQFLALTGAREKEALTVRWSDVDITREVVTIGTGGTSKNHKVRDVDFSQELAVLLREMLNNRPPDSSWLFPSPQRGKKDEPCRSLRESLLLVRKQAGFRPGLRHEAASLLAAWSQWTALDNKDWSALVLYLIASHHGKVRTVLRSSNEGADLFGLRDDDPPISLPDGSTFIVSTTLKSFAGQGVFDEADSTFTPRLPSWVSIIAELLGPAWRDDPVAVEAVPAYEPRSLGPFRLAYLEAIFRAADTRASQGEFQPAPLVTP